MRRKTRVHGYLGARWHGQRTCWRYRITCGCGWSYDAPASLWHVLFPAIRTHLDESRRCA